jgi:hypothetical protein
MAALPIPVLADLDAVWKLAQEFAIPLGTAKSAPVADNRRIFAHQHY